MIFRKCSIVFFTNKCNCCTRHDALSTIHRDHAAGGYNDLNHKWGLVMNASDKGPVSPKALLKIYYRFETCYMLITVILIDSLLVAGRALPVLHPVTMMQRKYKFNKKYNVENNNSFL